MLESELESEFVGLLEKIQQPDPTSEPGKQAEKARDMPVKLITGAYLSRLGLAMVPFDCHRSSRRPWARCSAGTRARTWLRSSLWSWSTGARWAWT